jgi:hypothetical protein
MELGYQGEQLTLHKITDKAVEIKGSARREPTDEQEPSRMAHACPAHPPCMHERKPMTTTTITSAASRVPRRHG